MPLSSANRLFQRLIQRGTSQFHSGLAYFTRALSSLALLVGNQAERDGGKPVADPNGRAGGLEGEPRLRGDST
jgi:hypothetical protein